MWRKRVLKEIGFFDEQLVAGSDFDFSLRLAVSGFKMCKTDQLLGYYTDEGVGISTRDSGKKAMQEADFLYKRYAVFDRVTDTFISDNSSLRLDEFLFFGEWQKIEGWLPNIFSYRKQRRYLKLLGKIRYRARNFFVRIGLLKYIHLFLRKVVKRDI
jgi:hypothetical protein